ncbi:MAG: YHS domain-containing protein [Planctomycetes bacterium]|nr:YHS domain-containing protein [Planctomycetota bacterium]
MGTEVTVTKNTLSAEYKGKVYYFCCGDCPGPFKANPEKYAK